VWEPAAGDGSLVRAMRAAGCTVIATDIATGQNFLHRQPPPECRSLATNPPFNQLNAFLARAVSLLDPPDNRLAAAVLLLRLDALAARTRAPLLAGAAAIHVCIWRPRWIAGSTTSPRWSFCWITWRRGHAAPPVLRWIRQPRQMELPHA
jgi:hypothetical protein